MQLLALSVVKLNLDARGWRASDILEEEATYGLHDGLLYWAGSENWRPEERDGSEAFWFSCGRLFWRPVEDGLGRRLRLGNIDTYDAELESIIDPEEW